jgi:hypothetical protein
MLAGSLPLRTVFSGTQGESPADFLEKGPCLTERQLPHEGDNSDGIVGNVKSDNYGGEVITYLGCAGAPESS